MSSSSSSSSTHTYAGIEKLNSTNYLDWKTLVKAVLREKNNAWQAVSETKPTDPADPNLALWEKRDIDATSVITLTVDKHQLSLIRNCATAREAWLTLESAHQSKHSSSVLLQRGALYATKLASGQAMREHVEALRNTRDTLASIDSPVSEIDMATLLLHSVGDEYKPVVNAFALVPAKELTFELVANELIRQEDLRSIAATPTANHAAFVSHAPAPVMIQAAFAGRAESKLCAYCGRKGHEENVCWTKDRHQQEIAGMQHNASKARSSSNRRSRPSFYIGFTAIVESKKVKEVQSMIHSERATNECHAAAHATFANANSGEWLIDSGASSHISHDDSHMIDFENSADQEVVLGDGRATEIRGAGNINVLIPSSSNAYLPIKIKNVLHAPGLKVNLLSVARLTDSGLSVAFDTNSCTIKTKAGEVLAIAKKHADGLYHLLTSRVKPSKATMASMAATATVGSMEAKPTSITSSLAHQRLGHLSMRGVARIAAEKLASGVNWSSTELIDHHCDACEIGKAHRAEIPRESTHRATQVLERVHSDICGPMRVASVTRARYYLTFIDEFSRFVAVYCITEKSEALNCFLHYKSWAENQTGKRIKCLRTDGGGEYVSKRFAAALSSCGVIKETTTPYTPEQNGMSERMNRTLTEMSNCMLGHAKLPNEFWSYSIATAAYIRNRAPTRALDRSTPIEAFLGQKPSLYHLRVFGCLAYAHIPHQKRSKLDAKARRCVFVGYPAGTKGYILYDTEAKKTFVSRDVRFEEHIAGISYKENGLTVGEGERHESTISVDASGMINDQQPIVQQVQQAQQPVAQPAAQQPIVHPVAQQPILQPAAVQQQFQPNADAARRSARNHASSRSHDSDAARQQMHTALQQVKCESLSEKHHSKRGRRHRTLEFFTADREIGIALAASIVSNEPKSLREAFARADGHLWERAAQDEMRSIKQANTYTLVEPPPGKNVIGCMWRFKIKPTGYKMRLVALGNYQEEGVDFDETFSPVAKFTTIRTVLALAAHLDLEVEQMDVRTAFLNGDLEHEIYMRQPEGFVEPGQEHLVCKLNRSLYGLRQAGRAWNQKINQAFLDFGLKRSSADNCVYTCKKNGKMLTVVLYVDDLLLMSDCKELLAEFKAYISSKFSMKDMGAVKTVLGFEIVRDRKLKTLSISQSTYIAKIVEMAGLSDCRPSDTPMEAGQNHTKSDCGLPDHNPLLKKYQATVGAIMYAMLGTRPDIAYAITILSQFNSNPGEVHWNAVQRVLRYLASTIDYKLVYGGTSEQSIKPYGFSDSNWGNDVDDRRSVTGLAFMLNGGAVCWQSKKQPTVALSSAEAEYMAASQATREAMWLRFLMEDLGFADTVVTPTIIYSDNQGAIALSKNPEHHARSKHIDLRHHFIREQVEAGAVDLRYVPTEEMAADVLTKPLDRSKHSYFSSMLGMQAV